MKICKVVVAGSELDYCYDTELQLGQRVIVPIRTNKHIGVITQLNIKTELELSRLKFIIQPLGEGNVSSQDLDIFKHLSCYYHTSLFNMMKLFLPVDFWQEVSFLNYVRWHINDANLLSLKKSPVYSLISDLNIKNISNHKRFLYGLKSNTIQSWTSNGLLQPVTYSESNDLVKLNTNIELNKDQLKAVNIVKQQTGFNSFLLFGVTGSGKTAVYQALINEVINEGNVLILIPEIRLANNIYYDYQTKFPEAEIDIIHSDLTKEQLNHSYFSSLKKRRIVIATRLGVMCNLPNVKLIIMDEEHDASYKQSHGSIRYHARYIATYRAWVNQIPIILGSATPSLSSIMNAQNNKNHHLIQLPFKAKAGSGLIKYVTDSQVKSNDYGISSMLMSQIKDTLHKGGQSLIFINNVGYARELSCIKCSLCNLCPHCGTKLVLFYQPNTVLECRLCEYKLCQVPTNCAVCYGNLKPIGIGTESVANYLQQRVPGYQVIQMDSYSKTFNDNLKLIQSGIPCIIVGTQIIITGYDLINIGLVGIIGFDSSIKYHGWQGLERAVQLLYQAMGRTGRQGETGKVIIQTQKPNSALLKYISNDNYLVCADYLLSLRREHNLPPFTSLAYIYCSDNNKDRVVSTAGYLFKQLTSFKCNSQYPDDLQIHEPAPCLYPKIANLHRYYLHIQTNYPKQLKQLITFTTNLRIPYTKIEIDLHPINLT